MALKRFLCAPADDGATSLSDGDVLTLLTTSSCSRAVVGLDTLLSGARKWEADRLWSTSQATFEKLGKHTVSTLQEEIRSEGERERERENEAYGKSVDGVTKDGVRRKAYEFIVYGEDIRYPPYYADGGYRARSADARYPPEHSPKRARHTAGHSPIEKEDTRYSTNKKFTGTGYTCRALAYETARHNNRPLPYVITSLPCDHSLVIPSFRSSS